MCSLEFWESKDTEIRTHKTLASTGVLTHVLCVHAVSKRERQGHEQALMCSLVSLVSPWHRKDKQDTSEHISAHLCPQCPHGVEGRGIRTCSTRASTNVLTRVLCVRAVSK